MLPLSSHRIMRDMRAMMFVVLIRLVTIHEGNVVFPASGRITRPASLSAVFMPSACGRKSRSCVLLRFGWQHTFQFVGTGFSIYHGLPQKSFSSLLENNSFSSSAVLSSRTIAEEYSSCGIQPEAGVHVFCFREVEGVDTQPVDIVMICLMPPAYSIKMSQALLSL